MKKMKKFKSWVDMGTEEILKKPEYTGKKFQVIKNALPLKMSGVLLDFAAPLLDAIDMRDRTILESTIKAAVIIWNYAIMKSGQYPKILPHVLVKHVKKSLEHQFSMEPDFEILTNTLLERKKSLYPDNNRMIVDFNISWDKNGENMHLTVLSPE